MDLSVSKDVVSLKFTNAEGKELNTTTITPSETTFSLKDNGTEKQKTTLTKEKVETTFTDDNKLRAILTKDNAVVTVKDSSTTIDTNKIELKNKNSLCKLDSSGILFDTDKDVTINAGGKINITASGDTTIKGTNVKIN
jgi:hypothetical protein